MTKGAPLQPRYTCPTINKILEGLSKIQYAGNDLQDHLCGLEDLLEEVRQANSDLREHGEYYEALCREQSSEIEDLRHAIKELESALESK